MFNNYEENLIKENEWLIYKIISKYKDYIELDDLYQVASIGIIKASRNYKNNFNTKFSTYAYTYVLGEVIKYVNDYKTVKVSKELSTIYREILRCKDIMTQKLMREPNTYELSLFMELDENIINEAIKANQEVDSLDRIIESDDKDMKLYEVVGFDAINLDSIFLRNELSKLAEKEKRIIYSKYYLGNNQEEIGAHYGMHQVEVSRTMTKTLKKIRNRMVS